VCVCVFYNLDEVGVSTLVGIWKMQEKVEYVDGLLDLGL